MVTCFTILPLSTFNIRIWFWPPPARTSEWLVPEYTMHDKFSIPFPLYSISSTWERRHLMSHLCRPLRWVTRTFLEPSDITPRSWTRISRTSSTWAKKLVYEVKSGPTKPVTRPLKVNLLYTRVATCLFPAHRMSCFVSNARAVVSWGAGSFAGYVAFWLNYRRISSGRAKMTSLPLSSHPSSRRVTLRGEAGVLQGRRRHSLMSSWKEMITCEWSDHPKEEITAYLRTIPNQNRESNNFEMSET